jgi:hypothetical protein
MELESITFEFKGDWVVKYFPDDYTGDYKINIYHEDDIIVEYIRTPYEARSAAKNPTKTQANKLVGMAKKIKKITK